MIYDILAPLVKQSEGLRLKAYQDSVGVWTVGYGHTGSDVYEGLVITKEIADWLLELDMIDAVEGATELCPVLGDLQHISKLAAISDFVFNFGVGRLRTSTLRKLINSGQFDLVPAELRKWVWAKNKNTGLKEKLPGLIKRRNAEVTLWVEGDSYERSTTESGV